MTFDSIIAIGIVIGAAFYLYRKFAKNKSGGCGCSSGGGCCGSQNHMDSTRCCSTKH